MSFDRNSIYDPFETVTHAAFQNDKFSFRARTWEINRSVGAERASRDRRRSCTFERLRSSKLTETREDKCSELTQSGLPSTLTRSVSLFLNS